MTVIHWIRSWSPSGWADWSDAGSYGPLEVQVTSAHGCGSKPGVFYWEWKGYPMVVFCKFCKYGTRLLAHNHDILVRLTTAWNANPTPCVLYDVMYPTCLFFPDWEGLSFWGKHLWLDAFWMESAGTTWSSSDEPQAGLGWLPFPGLCCSVIMSECFRCVLQYRHHKNTHFPKWWSLFWICHSTCLPFRLRHFTLFLTSKPSCYRALPVGQLLKTCREVFKSRKSHHP